MVVICFISDQKLTLQFFKSVGHNLLLPYFQKFLKNYKFIIFHLFQMRKYVNNNRKVYG